MNYYDFTRYGLDRKIISGKTRVWNIVIGAHVTRDTQFKYTSFSLTGLDDFYSFHKPRKDVFPIESSSELLTIRRNTSFETDSKSLDDIIHLGSSMLKDKVEETRKCPQTEKDLHLVVKNREKNSILITYKQPKKIDEFIHDINQVSAAVGSIHLLLFQNAPPQNSSAASGAKFAYS